MRGCVFVLIIAIETVTAWTEITQVAKFQARRHHPHWRSQQVRLHVSQSDKQEFATTDPKMGETRRDFSSSFGPRRSFLSSIGGTAAALTVWSNDSDRAEARGLVKFPCKDFEFLNKYHFVRAGESLLEEEGVWSTNPLFLTNREAALSLRGMGQVEHLCEELRTDGIAPTVVRYSLAASAIDTADIIGKELKVGRDRLVPEFNFMDPRAIGSWDMSQLSMTYNAVWAMDADEAGTDGTQGRPPANEDGTPHETLADQVVRLQQLISVLETQYSGDTILLVFPDGTGPALLTCLIGGVPLNRVHELEYRPGEIRLDVNYSNARAYLSRTPSEQYTEAIANGRNQLKYLREHPDEVLNVRDQQYSEELRREKEVKARIAEEKAEKEHAERLKKGTAKRSKKEEAERLRKKVAEDANMQNSKEMPIPSPVPVTGVGTSPLDQNVASVDSNTQTIAGLTLVGAIGAGALFADSDSPEEQIQENTTSVLPEENTQDNAVNSEPKKRTNGTSDSIETSEVKGNAIILEEDVANESSSEEETGHKDPDPQPAPAPVIVEHSITTWDPDEDDGGLAWLGALSEMMEEEDENPTKEAGGGTSTFE